jgi:hypothetical protein
MKNSKNLHSKIILVLLHGVDRSHERAIISIKATAEICNHENTVQTEHRPRPRRIFRIIYISSYLYDVRSIIAVDVVDVGGPNVLLICLHIGG